MVAVWTIFSEKGSPQKNKFSYGRKMIQPNPQSVNNRRIPDSPSQRANDFPILNPSCDAHKPAMPAGPDLGIGTLRRLLSRFDHDSKSKPQMRHLK
jgi:hypothetical protein